MMRIFVLDIDECKIAKGICGAGKCINTPGSFRCQCEPGYRNSMMMEMCMGKSHLSLILKLITKYSVDATKCYLRAFSIQDTIFVDHSV